MTRIPRTGTIFLDAGTTVQALANKLTYRSNRDLLVVVTNSVAVAAVLAGAAGVELHVLRGMFLYRHAAVMGVRAIRALDEWSFDEAFLGGEGMDVSGISSSHESIACFQQAILRRASRVYFCLDASKLGHATQHQVTTWRQVSMLITDATAGQMTAQGIALP